MRLFFRSSARFERRLPIAGDLWIVYVRRRTADRVVAQRRGVVCSAGATGRWNPNWTRVRGIRPAPGRVWPA